MRLMYSVPFVATVLLAASDIALRNNNCLSEKSALDLGRNSSQPLQHRMVKLLPSKKVDPILKLTSLK